MTATLAAPRAVDRLPRALHPLAWWVWAMCLGVVASSTTNPVLLGLLIAVLGFVVASRRTDAPWARGFRYYVVIAAWCLAIRVLFRAVFSTSGAVDDHVLFRLPVVHAPHWYAGVQLGGPVSVEGLLAAAADGLRLGALLCCVGAANVLANPKRALRMLPAALYELGVAVVVAISAAPQLVESLQRVRRARRLRGGGGHRWAAWRSVVVPVLEDALERSLRLAAAMDSRGYGRARVVGPGGRRLTAAFLVGGMCSLCLGVFGLLDVQTPRVLGLPTLLAGAALCAIGLALGGRRVVRTQYRPDPWLAPEWAIAALGVTALALTVVGGARDAATLYPTFSPLAWPGVPLLPAVGILLAALAAVVAPPPVRLAQAETVPA